ncbi:MAG: epimerase, partial [Rhodoferax sp.]|nr:epimerase [Rhodoferax sp.]
MTPSKQPAVLILGANGRIGVCLAPAILEAGWRVIAQLRRSPDPRLPVAVKGTQTDIGNAVQLARDAAGASIVVHALNPLYTRWATELLPMASAAMDVAQRLDARLLLPGSVYNFGALMPPLLLEDTPQTA